MSRVLITGASGLLGAALLAEASVRHEAVGVTHLHPVAYPGTEAIAADLTQPGQVDRILDEVRPDWIVHCAAATDVDRCEREPDWAERLNRILAREVARGARRIDARLAHLSTDAVFDGESGPYREESAPGPINVYGRTKRQAEQEVAEALPSALVVRTNLYGWNIQPKRSLAEWFLDRLRRGESCPGFTDVFAAPLLANDLALSILQLLERGCQGIYHVASSECVSKFEFGRRVAAAFGLDAGAIRPVRVAESGLAATRPRRLCLGVAKAEAALGGPMPDIAQGLERFRALEEADYAGRFRVEPQSEHGHSPN